MIAYVHVNVIKDKVPSVGRKKMSAVDKTDKEQKDREKPA